jgi:hypothetical protein
VREHKNSQFVSFFQEKKAFFAKAFVSIVIPRRLGRRKKSDALEGRA